MLHKETLKKTDFGGLLLNVNDPFLHFNVGLLEPIQNTVGTGHESVKGLNKIHPSIHFLTSSTSFGNMWLLEPIPITF